MRGDVRKGLRLVVLAAWAAAMVVLFRGSEPPAEPLAAPSGPLSAEAREDWRGIYSGEKKIGYARRLRQPTPDGFRLEDEAVMKLSMMGAARLVRTTVVTETDRALALRSFDFRMRSEGADFAMQGTVRDGRLEVRSKALGDRSVAIPPGERIALSETLDEHLRGERLEPGKRFRWSVFDPLAGEMAPVSLTVGAEEAVPGAAGVRAFRIEQEFRGSKFTLWAKADGTVLREQGPLGLTLVREDAETALASGLSSGDALDLVALASIPTKRPIEDARSLGHLRLRVSGLDAGRSLHFPPRQLAEGDLLDVRVETEEAIASYALPAAAPELAADLAPTPFLQADDAGIRARAAEILAGESDARRAAEKLVAWVYEHLEKVATISVPNAREVLAAGSGDCNEHAVLFGALARAAGLPARVVAGTAYMPAEGAVPGGFYYHAWNEVWLGAWTAVDPTFGQFPADATHVKIVEGGPETHAAILPLLGNLRLEPEA